MIRIVPALLVLACLGASEPPPKAASLAPQAVRRGAAAEIVLTGERLAGATSFHVGAPGGVTAEVVSKEPKKVVARVTVTADAAPGEREIRVITPSGVSNPVTFIVSNLPVFSDKEPNNSVEAAQRVELPAMIAGVIHAGPESDFFRFEAKKGQRLIGHVTAARAGSKLDSSLTLLDASGRLLARSEDALGLDSLLDFPVPDDGEYVVSIRDALYKGGGDYTYRLELGHIPHIDAIFPLGGQRGQKVTLSVTGRNLEGVSSIMVDLDSAAPLGPRFISAETPIGPSTAHPFEVGDLPESIEEEGRTDAPLAVPGVINGRIGAPGDSDAFTFTAGEPAPLVFEVTASRYGSPLDALLTLSDAAGAVVAQNDDAKGAGADARIEFKDFKKGARYTVSLRDLTDRGGPRFAYRLTVRPPKTPPPDFSARFIPDAVVVSRGSHARVWAEVTKMAGFSGAVTLAFKGLPAGVTCDPVKMDPSGMFVISAAEDAATGSFPVTLEATGGTAGIRIAEPEIDNRAVHQAFVTVLEPAAFTISPAGPVMADEAAKRREEIAVLEKKLAASTPELEAAQAEWEKGAGGTRWTILEPLRHGTTGRATLKTLEDGSILAGGQNEGKGTHMVTVRTVLKGITGFRLEALPDPSLTASGPGRAMNGNFVLSEFKVLQAPPGTEGTSPQADVEAGKPVALHKPSATFSQEGWPVAHALDGSGETGWAVMPRFGEAHTAIFETQAPLGEGAEITLVFALEHNSVHAQHVLGRFRISATTSREISSGISLPDKISRILDLGERSDRQKADLAAYYRSISPDLVAARSRIEELKSAVGQFPPRLAKGASTALGVEVHRRPGFTGEISVTLDGFSVGRDEKTKQPNALAKNLEVSTLTLKGAQTRGLLTLKTKPACEVAVRLVALRAEAKVDGQVEVQYSAAFTLAVGAAGSGPPPKKPATPAPKQSPKPGEAGLDYKYFEGVFSQISEFADLAPSSTGTAGGLDLTKRNREDNFAFIYAGLLDISKAGEYTFYLTSDDGSRLTIDGKVVVDNDGLHGPEEKNGRITLTRGKHPVTIHFFEQEGGETLELHYEGPQFQKQAVPAYAFHRAR